MLWKKGRRSDNVEDRRGSGVRMSLAGGGIGTIVLALVALYFGVDPSVVLQGLNVESTSPTSSTSQPISPEQEQLKDFVSVVLADTEDTWTALFHDMNGSYEYPKLVLFSGAVQSACGMAESAMGPFYCPGDHKVYIDLGFYDELRQRFGATGDFAQAYVIAHEVGHHVQNLLGISDKVHTAQQRAGKEGANALSVRLELQADCLAGVWANHADRTRKILETGDVDEALTAAAAIGDDHMQRQAQGYVVPESFTHGSSEQRVRWFNQGFKNGTLEQCNTFAAKVL
jgi:uncharacterized protein